MLLESCLTVLSVAERATKLYDWFTGVSAGDQLKKALAELERTKKDVQRLSDRLVYVPGVQEAVSNEPTKYLRDARQIRELLDPVAASLETDMLTTSVVATPRMLRDAFQRNPWELLIDVRPADRAKSPLNPDLIPIMFTDGGRSYVGYQTRGALRSSFNCEFHHGPELWLPAEERNSAVAELNPRASDVQSAVLETLRKYIPRDGLFVAPDIPSRKMANAVDACDVPEGVAILGLIDATWWGSAKNCLLFSDRGLYIKNDWRFTCPNRTFISYADLAEREVTEGPPYSIGIGDWYFDSSNSKVGTPTILQLLLEVRFSTYRAAQGIGIVPDTRSTMPRLV